MAPPRAYVSSALPLEFQSEVVVTNASLGPARFSIRSQYSNWEFSSMCSELEMFELDQLPIYPVKGTPCIAKISKNLHRGLVLSTNRDQNISNIFLVDFGYVQTVSHDMLYEIPDEIMLYPMFSTSVSLADGEALSKKPGLNEIFSTVVSIPDYLKCEVIEEVGTHQKVILYTPKDENVAEIVLRLHNNQAPKYTALSPAISEIETPPATSISSAPKSAFASAYRFRSPHTPTGVSAFGNASDGTSMTTSAGGMGASPNAGYENRFVFRTSGSIEIPVRSPPVLSASDSSAFGQQRSTGFSKRLVEPVSFGRATALDDLRVISSMIGRMGSEISQNAAGTNRSIVEESSILGDSSPPECSTTLSATTSPEFSQQNSTEMFQPTPFRSPSGVGDASVVSDAQNEQPPSVSFITSSKPSAAFDTESSSGRYFDHPAAVTASSVTGQPVTHTGITVTTSPLFGLSPAVTDSSAFGQAPALTTSSVFVQPQNDSTSPDTVFGQPAVTNAGLDILSGQVTTPTLISSSPTSALISAPIPIENSISLDLRQPLQDVNAVFEESTPVIDQLAPIPPDDTLVPPVQVADEISSDSSAIRQQTIVEEDDVVSVFDDDEPSISDTMTNHSISTAETIPSKSVNDVSSDEPSIQIGLQLTIPVEEEQKTAVILMEMEEEGASNLAETVVVEDSESSDPELDCTVRDDEKPAASYSDPFALSGAIVHEEKNIDYPLTAGQNSNPTSTDLIISDDEVPIFLEEVATAPILSFTHTHPTHSSDSEEGEEQAFVLESTNDLKSNLIEEESISEPVNADGIEEEPTSGLEEKAAEFTMNEHPIPVQPTEASSSDIKEEEANHLGVRLSVLHTPLHFAALATDVKQAESASLVIEKECEKELMIKEKKTLESGIENNPKMMEQSSNSSSPTSDRSVLDGSSNLDLSSVSMVCNYGEKSGDAGEQSGASTLDFMNDSFIKELLGGPLDSSSDWKTVAETISMVGKVLSGSTEDSVIINSGEVDESQAYIPDENDVLVETETEEGEPLGSE